MPWGPARRRAQRRAGVRRHGRGRGARGGAREAGGRLRGGSLSGGVRGGIRVRQRSAALGPVTGEDGIRRCAIVFEPALIPTLPRPRRAFQGWRYFAAADAPPDIGAAPGDDPGLPPGLREALTKFGVLGG